MKQLSKTFSQLHGISSLLNLAGFGALVIHGSVSVAASVVFLGCLCVLYTAAAAAAAACQKKVRRSRRWVATAWLRQ